ncbi:MAG: ABC transporter substrate-binding protein [Rhodospirillales bacterium]
MRRIASLLLIALLLAAGICRADVPEVRFAQQFSMGYLQFNVMNHMNLLQKHAAALGIPEVKISYITFNGPDMMNDALLSGAVDIASGGVPGLLTIWAKTKGTPQEIRGVAAMSQQVVLLTSKDPNIKTIRDFKPGDRIALPAVKVSAQATMLQMAAAKEWGDAAFDRLDSLTFAMSPPDATAGMLSAGGDFMNAFTVPPFQNMQLKDPAIHVVLSSEDVVGPSTGGTSWTSKRFHDGNPKLYLAIVNAMQEASEFIAVHPRETAEFYAADVKGKIDIDLMVGLLQDPRYKYVLTPRSMTKWSDFMFKMGRIKHKPESWKDLYWPEIHGLDGS